MKQSISELKDKEGKVDIEVKIIWDKAEPKKIFGKTIKTVLVADVLSEKNDGSPTAYLDLIGSNINKFQFKDIIKIKNAYTKQMKNNSGQYWITNPDSVELVERPK